MKKIINDSGRTCNECSRFLPWSEFHKRKKGINGRRAVCKECVKKYYESRREEILINEKEYRIEKADEISARKKKYYLDHKEDITENHKIYREEHADDIAARTKIFHNSPTTYSLYGSRLTELEDAIEGENGILLVRCATCNRYFTPTYQEVVRRVQCLNGIKGGESRLYCSEKCKDECSVFNQRETPKDFKKSYSSNEFPDFVRDEILKRDKYKCQICGETHDLHAHHMYPGAIYHNLSKDVPNGITLCKKCHIKVHSLPGCGFNEIAACSQRIKKELEEQGINLNEIPDWAVDKYMNKETLKGATP